MAGDGGLFSEGLAERQWSDFSAQGFIQPVTGVIYRHGTMMPGMPLGTIGTGFIGLGTDGTLDYIGTINNAFLERKIAADAFSKPQEFGTNTMLRQHIPTFRKPFLGLAVDGETTVLSLRSTRKVKAAHLGELSVGGEAGLIDRKDATLKDIVYWGHYPIADLQYEMDSPIQTAVRCWTPFIPGDAAASNTPGGVFEVTVLNSGSQTHDISLGCSFYGPRKTELNAPPGTPPAQYDRYLVEGDFTGMGIATKIPSNAITYQYAYALGVVNESGSIVFDGQSVKTTLTATGNDSGTGSTDKEEKKLVGGGGDLDYITKMQNQADKFQADAAVRLKQLKKELSGQERIVRFGGRLEGNSWPHLADGLPQASGNVFDKEHGQLKSTHGGCSVVVDFKLEPGATQKVHFVLAWYAPYWSAEHKPNYFETMTGKGGPPEKIYKNKYASRFANAVEAATYLSQNHESLLKRILAWQQVVYAQKSLPGWLQDSLINVLALIPQQGVWVNSTEADHWWGDFGFFNCNESFISCPQSGCLGNDWIGQWPIDLMYPDLADSYLKARRYYQDDAGGVPFAVGGFKRLESPYQVFQIPMNNQYYIHMIDRLWQSCGEDERLRAYWPSIKKAVNFLKELDKDGDCLVEMAGTFSQYHEGIPDAVVVINSAGYWLSTLKIAERMAQAMDDADFAGTCRSWYETGKVNIELLWNSEVGSYRLFNVPDNIHSETVLADQLTGEWSVCLHGLEGIFEPQRVAKLFTALERLNVAATDVGIKVAVHPKGIAPQGFSQIVPSYSTLIPSSLMVYYGNDHYRQLGLEIVRRCWYNMTMVQNMTWDQPCTLNVDGSAAYGCEYYHNSMLWSFALCVLNQDIKSACGTNGFIGKIIQAANHHD